MDCVRFIVSEFESEDENHVLQMKVVSVTIPTSCSDFTSGWGCGNFSVYDGK